MDKGSIPAAGAREDPLVASAREAIKAYAMLEPGQSVLVALSGGADSVALLLALDTLGYTVSACHLHHGLRGAEADRDEAFCRALCGRMDIPLVTRREDAAVHAKKLGESIETAARALRYAFFARAVQQTGADKIATAHTASDNLETMLFHLARGTGLDGLCGIPPVRENIVRPLIACTRAQVEAFLHARGQSFVVDSSNLSAKYTRNRIRGEIIPVLKAFNPKVEQAATGLSVRLREDAALLHEQAEVLKKDAVRASGWSVRVLHEADPAIRARALRLLCIDEGIPARDLTAHHVKALEKLIAGKKPSARLSLPGGFTIFREYNRLRVAVSAEQTAPNSIEIPVHLPFSGTLGAEFAQVSMKCIEKDRPFYKTLNTFQVDCDTIDVQTLVLRTRRAGDRLRLGGGSKALKRLLIDKKIPRFQRDRLMVLADCHGLIAVQDVGMDVSRSPKGGGIYEIQFEG